MEPEEKEKLVAETNKLEAEAKSLQKSGWHKPSAWLPTLAAIAAIGAAISQYQVSSIKDREAALSARERAIEAKEEQAQLIARNKELEETQQTLDLKISSSQKSLIEIKRKFDQQTEALNQLASKSPNSSVVREIQAASETRTKEVQDIVESEAEKERRSAITRLIADGNSLDFDTRSRAQQVFLKKHLDDPLAISMVLEQFNSSKIMGVNLNSRVNYLRYLLKTKFTVWDDEIKSIANLYFNHLMDDVWEFNIRNVQQELIRELQSKVQQIAQPGRS